MGKRLYSARKQIPKLLKEQKNVKEEYFTNFLIILQIKKKIMERNKCTKRKCILRQKKNFSITFV